jgi:phosphomannomutase
MINDDILIGAEESGGIGIKGHLPERDGIYNGLLFCEMLSAKNKKLSELIKGIEEKFGKYYYKRIDKHLSDNSLKDAFVKQARGLKEIAGFKVVNVDNLDGCKLIFNEGWLLIRPSGTEPLLRIYTETFDEDNTDIILNDILKKFNLN